MESDHARLVADTLRVVQTQARAAGGDQAMTTAAGGLVVAGIPADLSSLADPVIGGAEPAPAPEEPAPAPEEPTEEELRMMAAAELEGLALASGVDAAAVAAALALPPGAAEDELARLIVRQRSLKKAPAAPEGEAPAAPEGEASPSAERAAPPDEDAPSVVLIAAACAVYGATGLALLWWHCLATDTLSPPGAMKRSAADRLVACGDCVVGCLPYRPGMLPGLMLLQVMTSSPPTV